MAAQHIAQPARAFLGDIDLALYFLSYDLRKQRDYQPLYDELERFHAVRVLESVWAFKRINTTAEGLRDHFRNFIDADDGLLVVESTGMWATFRAQNTPNDLP